MSSVNPISASLSRTEQTYIVMPQHLNGAGFLYGGELLSWIDMVASITGHRHCDLPVVTASIDHLNFHDSAELTDVITLVGEVTYTGTTSFEVRVTTFKENRGREKKMINQAYLVMVALDHDTRKPTQVPPLLIETPEQQEVWDAALQRREYRKLRYQNNF